MAKLTDESVLRALRFIQASLEEEICTPADIERAKAIAAKLYVSHTNRKITLSNESFQMVIDFLQYLNSQTKRDY